MRTETLRMANIVVALIFLLGAGAAQAQTIQTSDGGTNATGILDLEVDGATYDVTFEEGVAASPAIYGPAPGIYTFDTNETAAAAADAVNVALETEPSVEYVGPESRVFYQTHNVGFRFRTVGGEAVDVWPSSYTLETGWLRVGDSDADFDFLAYNFDERIYAVFHLAGDIDPEMALSVSTLTPLVTSGSDGQDSVGVGNPGGGTLDWTAAADESWLSLEPVEGSVTSGVNRITVNYLSAGLEVGDYNATITVSAAGLSPQTIDVTLTVTPPIEVITNTQGQNATDILNLIVDDELYDVAFESDSADSIYGPGDAVFDFPSEEGAVAAVDAATKALNDAGRIKTVGPARVGIFLVGFNLSDGVVDVIEGEEVLAWQTNRDPGTQGYDVVYTYANFQALEGPPPAPRIDFSADPETIQVGESSMLSWVVLYATSCTGSGDWDGDKDSSSGNEEVFPEDTSTYVLTCVGDGSESESEVSVAVHDPTVGTTEAEQTKKVNTIPGIGFGVDGTYDKPGFPFLLPQSGLDGNTLFHDGGSSTFSVGETSYTYTDWTFELRTTCAADGDACLVQTDEGTPWALRNVEPAAGTARMVFTDEGAAAFNDLAVAPSIVQVFVTSQSFPGDLQSYAGEFTGLDGADSICTNAAKAAEPELAGAWTAWISDVNTDVVDRMFDAEFQRLDGEVVATSLDDLTNGTLDVPINVDENGNTVAAGSDGQVWTATDTDGRFGNSGTCNSWTSSDAVYSAQIGEASSVAAGWTDVGGGNSCDKVNRLYCFSASKFLTEETFANATIRPAPEPSAAALATAALTALGLIARASRRRRR